jgi:outer membrane immunogenic protein
MKKGFALFAAASAMAFAIPAAAQNENTFTGPRVEALVGYDSSQPGSSVNVPGANDNFDGVNYGVGVGYDFDLGSAVVGVEGEFMESEAHTEFDTTGVTGFGVSNIDAGRDLYVGGRVGFKVGPNSLIYAKAGYTNATYNVLATDNATDTATDLELDGWRVGGGAEVAVNNNIYVKGEYRYSQYSEGQVEAPNGATSSEFDVDVDRHQFVVGVGARF